MRRFELLYLIFLILVFSCKKEATDGPVNQDNVNVGLDCETCLASDLSVEATLIEENNCDDFTDTEVWPETGDPTLGEVIGFTQGGLYPVTYIEGDFASINVFDPGIFGLGLFDFAMNVENESVEFHIYSYDETFSESYVQVDGSAPIELSGDFPITVEDVVIDLVNTDGEEPYSYANLSFTGTTELITFYLFEVGITQLCVPTTNPGPPIIENSEYASFGDFYDYSGSVLGSHPNEKTPLGHYGLQATNILVDYESYLGRSPKKIGFVHAYLEGTSNLVNVQLPGTPLIVTVPDSLDYYLSPFGYEINHYSQNGLLWENETLEPLEGAQVDSIIITGSNLGQVTLGANLQESELRSVCSYYEQ